MKGFSWDERGFIINGERQPLLSGELHYFRVPYKDWRFRLERLKETGANAVSTYVPWFVHEPAEGKFLIDDVDHRKLGEFLKICDEIGLLVFLRPGPYIYSELTYSGLPEWVYNDYPEISTSRRDGSIIKSASYLHPVFLEKTERYIKWIAEYIKPYTVTNGGPVAAIQLDNEIGGIHIWNGTLDYTDTTMGFGKNDGRYASFLKKRYNSIDAVSKAYGFDYSSFADVDPRKPKGKLADSNIYRINKDYNDFYSETMAEYAGILADWYRTKDIDIPLYLNTPIEFTPRAKAALDRIQQPLFVGTDHYYNLDPFHHKGNAPTPQEFVKWAISLDMLTALGVPASVLELQSGSFSDYPPMLTEDLKAMYFAHSALGLKGMNYYVFSGGPNIKGTGETGDYFDFNAPISWDNKVRPTIAAIADYNDFALKNTWLQAVERTYDVQIGFTWEQRCDDRYMPDGQDANSYMSFGFYTALISAGFQPKYIELGEELDENKLLVVACEKTMARSKQQNIVEFLEKGGKLLIAPFVPELDENAQRCTVLKDYLGFGESEFANDTRKMITAENAMYYFINNQRAHSSENAEVLAHSQYKKLPVIIKKGAGKGECILFGAEFLYQVHSQAEMMTTLCERLGYKPQIVCDNKTIWFTSFSDGENKMIFAINLYSGKQEADVSVTVDGEDFNIGHIKLEPMTVLPIRLK